MRSILLLPLVVRYLEIIDVCIWRMFGFACCSDCRNVCRVVSVVEDSVLPWSVEVSYIFV